MCEMLGVLGGKVGAKIEMRGGGARGHDLTRAQVCFFLVSRRLRRVSEAGLSDV